MQKFLDLTIGLSAVICFVPTVSFSLPLSGNQTLNNLAEKAKLEVSKTTGISTNRLSIANTATLANTGITRFKLRDIQGNMYGVSLDSAGNQISRETLEQAIQAINNKGFVSKLEAELANHIAQGSNSPHSLFERVSMTANRVAVPLMVCGSLNDIVVKPDALQGWRSHLKEGDRLWSCLEGWHFFHFFQYQLVAEQLLDFWKFIRVSDSVYSCLQR